VNELRTFLELWEIPITRRNLESHLEQITRIFKDEIAAHRKDRAGSKVEVQVFVNSIPSESTDVLQ
jgi:hypothetical protein